MKITLDAHLRATISAASLSALLLAGWSAPAVAGDPRSTVFTGERILLAGKMKVRGQRIYGGSPYICTPSGFGQKARCFLRSTIA